ncbi:ribonuclease P [Halobacteriales archaeon QS_1_68_20]|nr:MAG: ribonuclease P [Halobacteriales archaeon QS_1_68_20]
MPLTPETLPRHELVGLRVEVVDAATPDLVGIDGRVVRETTRTLDVRGEESRVRTVPKPGTTFQFTLTDEAADRPTEGPRQEAGREGSGTASKRSSETAGQAVGGESSPPVGAGQSGACEGVAYVTVDGARLLSRPARRTETGGSSKWR